MKSGMHVIWKMAIGREPVQEWMLPAGAQVVHVAWQDSQHGAGPMMWVRVDDSAKLVPRKFLVVCTGDYFPSNGVHLGTFETARDFEILHLIEVEA